MAGCASAGGEVPDGEIVGTYADEASRSTVPERPLHIVFAWSLQEREARFSGEGVARFEPPARARLDLFGPRGETVLAAALVELELRLPPGVTDAPLPPPALLWSALGIFRAPEGATLVGTRRDGSRTTLVYEAGAQRWRFELEDGRLRSAEWTGPGQGRRTVELGGAGSHGLPANATYRDWPAFTELKLTLEEANEVDGFPSDTWTPGR